MSRDLHAMAYLKLSSRSRHYSQTEGVIKEFKRL